METDGFDSPLSAWLSARFASSAEQALSTELARWRGISPQAANQQLRKHVAAGALSVRAQGRRNLYRLMPVRQASVAYARADEFTFDKTVVPLRLAVYGNENLMSRSQAKRVLSRVERFRTVLFDFEGVAYVGQGFADEIFRVFANEHPGTELIPINTNADIGQMVSRAMRGRGSPAPAGG